MWLDEVGAHYTFEQNEFFDQVHYKYPTDI